MFFFPCCFFFVYFVIWSNKGLLSVQIYRISALEKDRNTPLYSRRSEFRKDYCELEEFDLKGTNDRKSESEYHLFYLVYCVYTPTINRLD